MMILYNIENKEKEQQLLELLKEMGIDGKSLDEKDAGKTVGELAEMAGGKAFPKKNASATPSDYTLPEVLIFAGLPDETLDEFLAKYKGAGIAPVGLKAIVTVHNVNWTLYELIEELKRERIAMMLGRR